MSLKELAPSYYTRLKEVTEEVGFIDGLLNAGCGDGLFDKFLKVKAKNVVSLDLNKGDIKIAKCINPGKNVIYYVGSIEDIPHKSNIFDCVICIEVLEHLKKDEKAIKELARVLKKEGKLIITIPSKDFPFSYDPINYILKRFGKKINAGAWSWGHERLYSVEDLEKKVRLKVLGIKYLSYSLVGFIENSYINSELQKFTKNDPNNRVRVSKDIEKIKKTVEYKAPKFLTRARDLIIWLDRKFFFGSKKSIGILLVFQK